MDGGELALTVKRDRLSPFREFSYLQLAKM